MSLKISLMLRVVLLALVWLAAAFSYFLVQSDRDAGRNATAAAEFVAKELELQLALRGGSSVGFPDLQILSGTYPEPGMCIGFRPADGAGGQQFCGGTGAAEAEPPSWFDALYRLAFEPGREQERPVSYRGEARGSVVVATFGGSVIARAWHETGGMLGLTLVTVLALSGLVYAAVARALRPVREILAGMNRLAEGDLAARLPAFRTAEFNRIGAVFNHLAARLEETIAERRALTEKLVTIQDEERRHLARELHDEFGQCLTAVNAIAASIGQTAEAECPSLLGESRMLARIAARMMDSLRGTLIRLRPPGIDELGLTLSLRELVAGWNGRSHGTPRFILDAEGDFAGLPPSTAVDLYRIAQECLTNAAKHADATEIRVKLRRRISPSAIELSVEDDGKAAEVDFNRKAGTQSGMGVLGIKERVASQGGEVMFSSGGNAGGVTIHARLPLPKDTAR